ncbi:hypothetical protein HAX54_047581 [Datura stramonium]|uniref:Uncharacterized protein n=1 Tax=Datura stramonium TaxID=4076 RepID=A0ABS8SSL7_DATST|nr:hypothetical protein [Datura stramonium]
MIDFFCTQAPKVDIGKSSFVDGTPINTDLKKKLNDFRLHVDVKFGEILRALGHLTKKLEVKKSYFHFVHISFKRKRRMSVVTLGVMVMDVDEDAYKVAPDSTPNVCEVSVGGEKTDVVGGGVHVGESIGDVNVNDQVSQLDFSFFSMRESAIASITQDYYKNKAGSQKQECDLKLNSEKPGDDDFFVDMSESDIALITKVVVYAATTNVNVAVNDEVVVDGSVPRQDVAHPATYVAVEEDDTFGRVAGVSNEPTSGVFVESVAVNESVVDPPSKDATCEALVGQVAYEVPGQATYTFIKSEHDSPECGIPPGSTVGEIGDDDKTFAVY